MPMPPNTLFKASLIALTLMIFGMVILGGLTRLTGSGLSIVEWKPITGILPPFTLHDWVLEFQKYQQSPEFQKINGGMTLSEFQSIYWLEYVHRLWGRLLGCVLLIPTYLMIFKKQSRPLWPGLVLLWLLGMAQGIMGWLMVKSGLSIDPYVSPYLLATHLLLGFATFATSLWMTLFFYKGKLQIERRGYSLKAMLSLKRLSFLILIFVLLTAFWGALVAGLKAGLVYNTFPLMAGYFVPPELFTLSPWWKDLLENPVSVQFIHRLLALSTATLCWGVWLYQYSLFIPLRFSTGFTLIATASLLQLSLGILTLIFVLPLPVALLHQGVAFIFFGSIIYMIFLFYSIKGEVMKSAITHPFRHCERSEATHRNQRNTGLLCQTFGPPRNDAVDRFFNTDEEIN